MNNAVKIPEELTVQEIETLGKAGIIPADTPPAIVKVFATACRQHNLSPFKKEIYLVRYNTKQGAQYHTIVGIDGFRVKAARTGQHGGTDDPKYNIQPSGQYETGATLKAAGKMPISCTVTVYRILSGQRCPFTATCIFDEYYPAVAKGQGDWSKAAVMPFNMIAKCAEAKALKMAFSDELAGLHIEEEAAAFEDATVNAATKNPSVSVDTEWLRKKIAECPTIEALNALYQSGQTIAQDGKRGPSIYAEFADLFTDRKFELNPELMLSK